MAFIASFGPRAERFLRKCEKDVYRRIREKVRELEQNPFPSEVETIKGMKGEKAFRVRVGSYRTQYVIYYDKNEILVFKIGKRDKAYD
jgi:mRNA-degrading endonuclease RelE of RelBE toxin-antitoxin system